MYNENELVQELYGGHYKKGEGEMNDFFKLFAQNVNFPLCITTIEDVCVYANKLFADIYNKDVKEIVNNKVEDIVLPEMAKIFSDIKTTAIETNEAVTREIQTPKGNKMSTLLPLKDDNGEIIYFAEILDMLRYNEVFIRENNTLKKEKSIPERIMDTLPDDVFFKDINGVYLYVNESCRKFHEQKGQNILGKTDYEVYRFTDKQMDKFVRDDKTIQKTRKPIYNEARFQQPDGSYLYRQVIKVPIIDDYGNLMGIAGRIVDITNRVLLSQKLEVLSYTDALTNIKNRACFEEKVKKYSDAQYLPLGLIMGDANGLKIVNDTLGHLEGDKLLKDVAYIMNEVCKNKGDVYRFGGDEFIALLPNTTLKECEALVNEITNKCDECKEEKFNISISLGASVKKDMERDVYDVLKEAEDKVYRKKLLQKKSVKNSILTSLKEGLSVKSGETESHTTRVAESAVKVGAMLDLEMSQLDELKIAADLHDIGKIGISEDILLKKGKLTDEEYKIMKTHSEKGYRIINAASELKSIAEAVLYHHERWDGKGYPMGLKGEQIPIISRIISVCDAFDVMTNDRIYKKAISKEEAIAEVKRCSGTQFDPTVVEAFLKCFDN